MGFVRFVFATFWKLEEQSASLNTHFKKFFKISANLNVVLSPYLCMSWTGPSIFKCFRTFVASLKSVGYYRRLNYEVTYLCLTEFDSDDQFSH